MTAKILFIAPYSGMYQLACDIVSEYSFPVNVVQGELYKGVELAKENENLIEIKNVAGKIDDSRLSLLLKMWHDKYPNKSDLVLYTDASVTYGQMIRVYDFLVSSEFKDVGINPY